MPLLAFTLQEPMRTELQSFGQGIFIVYVVVSFVCVAAYVAKQIRAGHLINGENPPHSFDMPPLAGWLFAASVIVLIFLQPTLYAMLVLMGTTGALMETGRSATTQFGLDLLKPNRAFAWSILGFGAIMLVEKPLTEMSAWGLDFFHISHPEQQSVETFRQYSQPSEIAWFLLLAVLIFPVIEELFFRGFLFTFLKKYTPTWIAIALSAAIFASAHLNLGAFLPLWFLGIVLGLAYEHTGCLLLPIGIHACFNLATGLSLLVDKGNSS